MLDKKIWSNIYVTLELVVSFASYRVKTIGVRLTTEKRKTPTDSHKVAWKSTPLYCYSL